MPLAFVEKQKGAMRLAALNRAAVECGLAVDANLADAVATVPDLTVHEHDALADAELLDRIADGCMRFSALVAVEQPDGIMLDITGGAHLFGGEQQLAREVKDWLCAQRMDARLAYGSSAEAAHALARFHRGRAVNEPAAIRGLPVAALQLDPEADLGLRRAGLNTIGDVMQRPSKVIAARFGADLIYRLERLTGISSKPINPRKPLANPSFRRRFAEPVTSQKYAVRILRDLLVEANAGLAEQDLGGRAFEARFHRVDGMIRHLQVETGLPTRDCTAIARLFDERLEGLADPLDPGFGFDTIELVITKAEALRTEQDDFQQKARLHNPLAETLDVLSARLGHNRVLRFRRQNTHIPEETQRAVPAIWTAQAFEWGHAKAGEPPLRPLHLFDPPHRIAVIAEIPDGPPRRFRWCGALHDVARYEGPERIAAEWWNSAGDPLGRDRMTRDYYRIEDAEGRRYWVFRHGLHDREVENPQWYLHGLFA